jgi:hypothetical protein
VYTASVFVGVYHDTILFVALKEIKVAVLVDFVVVGGQLM